MTDVLRARGAAPLRVLYLGEVDPFSTARHRADALKRLGHVVEHINPVDATQQFSGRWLGALNQRTGFMLTRGAVLRWVQQHLSQAPAYDLCWVDHGALLPSAAVRLLRQHCGRVVLFNHDDPTGSRDGARFKTLLAAVPEYDLCVVVRPINVAEFKARGARDAMRVWMGYDEVVHRPADPQAPVAAKWQSDVAFIGTCMPGEDRDLFLQTLIRAGIKPAIWGARWQRSPIWPELQAYWRGGQISGQDYVDAMRGARICIGMLSRGNRDEHTTRSMEIPYAGGLLCAQRTPEHQQLYVEGQEAVFWSDAQECANLCRALLADPERCAAIRAAGRQRVIANRVGHEDMCASVLQRLPG